jgi:hypothetical protein
MHVFVSKSPTHIHACNPIALAPAPVLSDHAWNLSFGTELETRSLLQSLLSLLDPESVRQRGRLVRDQSVMYMIRFSFRLKKNQCEDQRRAPRVR